MTDEEEVQLLILKAERQRDTLIAATKEQVAELERLSEGAECHDGKRHYLQLAVETPGTHRSYWPLRTGGSHQRASSWSGLPLRSVRCTRDLAAQAARA